MAHSHRPFYNLDNPVGRNCANVRDDVMLIQFFISELDKVGPVSFWDRPAKKLTVNGTADENLFQWIRSYQDMSNNTGQNIHADGRVDPARGASSTRSTITRTLYTIVAMNRHYESAKPAKYGNLPNDVTVPAALRKALQRRV